MPHVEFLLYPNCLPSTLFVPIEVFAYANQIWARRRYSWSGTPFSWRLVSPDGKPVSTWAATRIAVDGRLGHSQADVVVLPAVSGWAGRQDEPALASFQTLLPPLRSKHAAGAVIATIDNASILAAEAGLLDGGLATGNANSAALFAQRYPTVEFRPKEILTGFNNVLCAASAASCANLALYLVAKFAGPQVAVQCAQELRIAPQVIGPQGLQPLPTRWGDPLVSAAQQWIDETLAQPLDLRILADHLAVSQRTLLRRFARATGTSPTVYVQSQKIDLAKRLLASSSLSLAQICARVGYLDPNSFQRLFKRETGLTMAAYRTQHSCVAGQRAAVAASAPTSCAGAR